MKVIKNKGFVLFFNLFLILMGGIAVLGAPADQNFEGAGVGDLLHIPLLFIENRGQADPEARFYAKAQGYTLWITPGGMVFDVVRREPDDGRGVAPPDVREMMGRERKPAARGVARLRFVGAHPSPEIVPEEEAALSVNVFRGSDPSRWRGGIPTSRAVWYRDLYPGIDLEVYGVEKQVEYDWIVAPGADPGRIRFSYGDAADVRIDENGDLRVRTDAGDMVHRRPVAYQEIGGKRVAVVSAFRETAENICGFSVGDYDRRHPLVIDPVVLAYGTCLGGGGMDKGGAVAVADDSGVVYVAGRTDSADFPVRDGFQEKPAGGYDLFIAKIDTTKRGAESLLWCSYLGGSGNEVFFNGALAADGAGHVVVAIETSSSDFPTTPNAFQSRDTSLGSLDVVVAKLDTTVAGPASLVYATYLGGNNNEFITGNSIAVDDKGIIHVAGSTYSNNFPTTPDAFRTTKNGDLEAFVVKIDPCGNGPSDLLYGTYLGGNKFDWLFAMAIDGRGRAWVTGLTTSPDFPVRGGFQPAHHGKDDVFVACIDTSEKGDAALAWSSYLGGSENDCGRAIVSDGAGRLYLAGWTASPDFPVRGGFQSTLNGGMRDAFVACIDTSERGDASLAWSSYLGGSENEEAQGVVLDGAGRVYLAGATESPDFPVRGGFQTAFHGDWDGFVTCVEATGELAWSSYLGGRDHDDAMAIALDGAGGIYVTGFTASPDFPTPHAFQPSPRGGLDAFLLKLVPGAEVTVGKTGTGTGGVTSDPPGIDCGTDCSEAYPFGTEVTLTAVPEEGSLFEGWTGACTGHACTVVMTDNLRVNAVFTERASVRAVIDYIVPATAVAGGPEFTLEIYGGMFRENAAVYWNGSPRKTKFVSAQQLKAEILSEDVAAPGTIPVTVVNKTEIGESVESESMEFIVRDLPSAELTVEKVGAGTGRVTSDPPGIDCGTDCSEAYPYGTEVTLTAVPEEGSVAAWEGVGAGSEEDSLTVTMDGPKTVTIRFDAQEPKAIPTLDEYGMILLAVLLTGAALARQRRRPYVFNFFRKKPVTRKKT